MIMGLEGRLGILVLLGCWVDWGCIVGGWLLGIGASNLSGVTV